MNNHYNALLKVKDSQWLSLIAMLTEGVMAVSGRKIITSEIYYSEGGHYPAMYFRLTSVLEDAEECGPQTKVSGFVFGFDKDVDDEVYVEPLGADAYQEDWLKENGITHFFSWHEVGIKKLYQLLSEELKIWSTDPNGGKIAPLPNVWRCLKNL